MTPRKDPKAPGRPYYRFPWPKKAVDHAVKLATLHENQRPPGEGESYDFPIKPITFRTIAAELERRGFVDRPVDPATVRRLVVSQIGKVRAAR